VAEITEGARAPQFTLPAVNVEKIGMKGDTIALKDFKGDRVVVLYFYPRDNTKGCTTEAVGFRDLKGQFTRNDAVILGVSTDDIESHEKFVEKQRLNFPLLSDEDATVVEKYGVWREKKMYGKTFMGIVRSTFVIDTKGKIAKIWPKVSPDGHAEEVLEFVKEMS
jgi:peroxiredoxin